MRCCGPEAIVPPDKPLISALKSKNSNSKARSKDYEISRESSTASTRPPSYTSSSSEVSLFRPMRIDQVRVEAHFKKLRRLVLDVVGELNHFHVFVTSEFGKPGDAFDWLAESSGIEGVSFDDFTRRLETRKFTGRSDKVFYAFCKDPMRLYDGTQGLVVLREKFVQRLSWMGPPFRLVVRQLIGSRRWAMEPLAESGAAKKVLQSEEGGMRRRLSDPGVADVGAAAQNLRANQRQRSSCDLAVWTQLQKAQLR